MDEREEDLSQLVRRLNTSVGALGPRRRSGDEAPTHATSGAQLDALLEAAVGRGASDLLLVAAIRPRIVLTACSFPEWRTH